MRVGKSYSQIHLYWICCNLRIKKWLCIAQEQKKA